MTRWTAHLANPDWWDDAECRGMDPDVFFPEKYAYGVGQRAKRICARCPVIDECLSYAVAEPELHGIWGGLSVNERRPYRMEYAAMHNVPVRPPQPRRHVAQCGTNSGYHSHIWHKTTPCEACRKAHNEANAGWNLERRRKRAENAMAIIARADARRERAG